MTDEISRLLVERVDVLQGSGNIGVIDVQLPNRFRGQLLKGFGLRGLPQEPGHRLHVVSVFDEVVQHEAVHRAPVGDRPG
ncbi:hypothetical protein ACLMAJ_29630 [Nocardia sp. KC 131]|uniref:hypothetical protein n=1 Tax=Nocardia arseniciresistens TaxID=3392119 RepID=UPI00398F3E0B